MIEAVAMSCDASTTFSEDRFDTSEGVRPHRMFITVPREELDVNARRNTLLFSHARRYQVSERAGGHVRIKINGANMFAVVTRGHELR